MSDLIPDEELRMDAYYYGFHRTGVIEIDRILSAVARAGKAFHLTEDWNEPAYGGDTSPVDWIQNAANDAAAARRVSPVTREADELLSTVRSEHVPVEIEPSDTICRKCSFELPNGRFFKTVEWPCVSIELADALSSLSVSPPAEVEWEYAVRHERDGRIDDIFSEANARSYVTGVDTVTYPDGRVEEFPRTLVRTPKRVWVPVSPTEKSE